MTAPSSDRPLSVPHDLAAMLAAAGLDPARTAGCEPLAGGTYNTLHRVVLDDGSRLILKQPPTPGGPHLTYEADLIQSRTFRAFETYAVVTVIYLALSLLLRRVLVTAGRRTLGAGAG